jgi:hypothetical protein
MDLPTAEEIKKARDEGIRCATAAADLITIAKGGQPIGCSGYTPDECAASAVRSLDTLLDGLRDRGDLFDCVNAAIPPLRPAVTLGGAAGYTFHRAAFRLALNIDVLRRRADAMAFVHGIEKRDTKELWPWIAGELRKWPGVDAAWAVESIRAESRLILEDAGDEHDPLNDDELVYLGSRVFRISQRMEKIDEADQKLIEAWLESSGILLSADVEKLCGVSNASAKISGIRAKYKWMMPYIEMAEKRNKGYRLDAITQVVPKS